VAFSADRYFLVGLAMLGEKPGVVNGWADAVVF
jgi:hypothetical protein